MKFSCNFRSADCFLPNRKISTKGFWDLRIDSQVRLVSRLKTNVPYGDLLTSGFTGKLNGHLLPRKLESVPLVFRLSYQGKYSLGDINGYDVNNNDTHKADKELEARRSRDSMIDKVIDLSMALDDEAARLWIYVNQTLSEIQETAAEESCVNQAGQIATMEVAMAKARLCELLKAGDKEEAIISAENEVKEWLAKLTSFQDQLTNLKAKKDKLLKEAKMLKEAAKRKHTSALEAEEDFNELMIWTGPYVVNDAENKSLFGDKSNKRNQSEVLIREAIELEEANQELEAIRSRNSMISKGFDQLKSLEEEAAHAWNDANQILHVLDEMFAKEAVQKAVIVLSMGKESSKSDIKEMLENISSLQDRFSCMQIEKYELIKEAYRLSEAAKSAQSNALEAEEEVMEMMIWGEQAMRLERDAIRSLSDAETALKIAEKPHGEELDQAERKLSLKPSADNAKNTQKLSKDSDDVREGASGSLTDENSGSNLVDQTSKGSLAVENDDSELGGAFSSIVSRSIHGCNIDHLEQIIEDAKSNKRTLFTVMELFMNLMREVELQEKDAKEVKEDATIGGFDTLVKVEDLKKIRAHAKEGNMLGFLCGLLFFLAKLFFN